MAGDWIKMRVNLVTHPKVMRMAEALLQDPQYLEWSGLAYAVGGLAPSKAEADAERHCALRITRYVCVASMLRFWGYANEHAKRERIESLVTRDVDEIAGLPGFGDALASIGWVEFDPNGGVDLPGFSGHNTSVDERKTGGAARQKAYRERLKAKRLADAGSDVTNDVTNDVTLHEREDKIREEKNTPKASAVAPVVFGNVSDSIRDEWLALRKRHRAPVTQRVVDSIAKEALKVGMTLEQALAKCCDRGWRGFEAKWLEEKNVVSIKAQQQDDELQRLFRRGAAS